MDIHTPAYIISWAWVFHGIFKWDFMVLEIADVVAGYDIGWNPPGENPMVMVSVCDFPWDCERRFVGEKMMAQRHAKWHTVGG